MPPVESRFRFDVEPPHALGTLLRGRLEGRACERRVVVELRWSAVGSQASTDRHRVLARLELPPDPGARGREFQIRLPYDAPTHRGHEVSVRWSIAATFGGAEGPAEDLETISTELEVVPPDLGTAMAEDAGGPYRAFRAAPSDGRPLMERLEHAVDQGRLAEVADLERLRSLSQEVEEARVDHRLATIGVHAFFLLVLGPVVLLILGSLWFALFQMLATGITVQGVMVAVVALLVTVPGLIQLWLVAGRAIGRIRMVLGGGLKVSLAKGLVVAGMGDRPLIGLRLRSWGPHPIDEVRWELQHLEESARDEGGTRRGMETSARSWDRGAYSRARGTVKAPPIARDQTLEVEVPTPAGGPATLEMDTRRIRWIVRFTVVTPHGNAETEQELVVAPFRTL